MTLVGLTPGLLWSSAKERVEKISNPGRYRYHPVFRPVSLWWGIVLSQGIDRLFPGNRALAAGIYENLVDTGIVPTLRVRLIPVFPGSRKQNRIGFLPLGGIKAHQASSKGDKLPSRLYHIQRLPFSLTKKLPPLRIKETQNRGRCGNHPAVARAGSCASITNTFTKIYR